jgi:hypothetical protein
VDVLIGLTVTDSKDGAAVAEAAGMIVDVEVGEDGGARDGGSAEIVTATNYIGNLIKN